MACEADGKAIHATAVAIDGRAVVIFGASGAGKSSLAAELIRVPPAGTAVTLVGDDRLLLRTDRRGQVIVRPHPRIAGFIERRGFGIVCVAHTGEAPAHAVVFLDATEAPVVLAELPSLNLGDVGPAEARLARVRLWWRKQAATSAPQIAAKSALKAARAAKDYNCSSANI